VRGILRLLIRHTVTPAASVDRVAPGASHARPWGAPSTRTSSSRRSHL